MALVHTPALGWWPKTVENPPHRVSRYVIGIQRHFPAASITNRLVNGSPTKSSRAVRVEASNWALETEEESLLNYGAGWGVLYETPRRGSASPLGAVSVDGGMNFALYSSEATAVTLCLFANDDFYNGRPSAEIPLHPARNRTGHVWHIFLPALTLSNLAYAYRVDGPFAPDKGDRFDPSALLLDPYAKAVISRSDYGQTGEGGECWTMMAGGIPNREGREEEQFDWEGDTRPCLPLSDLVIYECHVRGATKHPSSGVSSPGTFAGLTEKLPQLKALGINALELLPIHEFNELEYYTLNPATKQYRVNFWGYSSLNFFSPMARYAESARAGTSDSGAGVIREFKSFVKAAHRLGMEVILDVVFNHTGEGNEMGPTISFRGLDNKVYYMTAPQGEFYNYSGCGNTLNCNHPVVRSFIVDCLRYWVLEMHVDGFRFDLASIMTRSTSLWDWGNVSGEKKPPSAEEGGIMDGGEYYGTGFDEISTGAPLPEPPLIDMISNDPVLKDVKLIAEAWDAGGLYQVGSFPHWGLWAEWNGQFRDVVRLFIKGTDGMTGAFAEALCGSPKLYQTSGRRPFHSINFVNAHDGFTLADMVSHNEKHNEANGEGNADGENHNNSWNCGQEGPTGDASVNRLRQRQMRNFLLALAVSQGVPMLHMGDEYGHTKRGNNNTYCHDNELNYLRWDLLDKDPLGLPRFLRQLLRLRRDCECFRLPDFPGGDRLQWHGLTPGEPDWSDAGRFIAFTMRDSVHGELYVAFNTSHLPAMVTLPHRSGFQWQTLVDTSRPSPFDFLSPHLESSEDLPGMLPGVARQQFAGLLAEEVYPMVGYSSMVLALAPAGSA